MPLPGQGMKADAKKWIEKIHQKSTKTGENL
jgi:hypothetical protein